MELLLRCPMSTGCETYICLLMHSQKNLSDNYTFAFAGPEEQSPSSGDEEGSTCDGWEDGAALGKDTGAVQSIKSQFFTSVFSFP